MSEVSESWSPRHGPIGLTPSSITGSKMCGSRSQLGKQGRVCSSSLFLLSETNILRRFTLFLIEWPPFEWTVLVTIIASCVVMALEEHLPNGDKTELAIKLQATEAYFLIIFCIEMCLKIVALGFVLHPGSYLRNVWNIMDFVVVFTG